MREQASSQIHKQIYQYLSENICNVHAQCSLLQTGKVVAGGLECSKHTKLSPEAAPRGARMGSCLELGHVRKRF